MKSGVIVLDTNNQVLIWNDYCKELWGLSNEEVNGQSIFELDTGLPVESLRNPLRTFIQLKKEYDELTLSAVNRRGKKITCVVRMTPLISEKNAGSVLLIDDQATEVAR
jgi:two-component system CheB/CheR fusion protein